MIFRDLDWIFLLQHKAAPFKFLVCESSDLDRQGAQQMYKINNA